MTKVLLTESTLYQIADEIRAKNGEENVYLPSEMPAAIRRIPTGGGGGMKEVYVAYVVGSTAYASDWLSLTAGGVPLTPEQEVIYIIGTGSDVGALYRWDGSRYRQIAGIASDSGYGLVKLDGETIVTDIVDGSICVGSVPAGSISGTIPSSALPSYVDDVLEYPTPTDFPAEGESGKIYVATTTNETYRWSGTSYVSISNPLDYATQAEAEAGVENTHVMTPLRVAQAIDPVRGAVADLAADMPSAATTSEAGLVIPDGTTITVDSDGTIHGASTYELPTMSSTTKGGALLGHGLEVTDGVLSVSTEGDGAIRSVTAEGWATQDGTPSPDYPQEIQVARGRNCVLRKYVKLYFSVQSVGNSGTIAIPSTDTEMYVAKVKPNTTYTLSYNGGNRCIIASVPTDALASGVTCTIVYSNASSRISPVTFTTGSTEYVALYLSNNTNTNPATNVQLESGSTATPYVPYGHVGLEVTHGGTTTTVPIPLPSKGFAASLPDGTCDTLTIDGAGHVEWESASEEYVVTGTEGTNQGFASIGDGWGRTVPRVLGDKWSKPNNAAGGYCTYCEFKWDTTTQEYHVSTSNDMILFVGQGETALDITQQYAGARVIYALATPTTEDCGYIDLPITVEGDTVDIPELEDVAVVRWADTVATEVAQAWYRRAQAVESRVAALEQAVAEIVAGA